MIRVLIIADIDFQIDFIRHLFEELNCAGFATMDIYCSPQNEENLQHIKPKVGAIAVKKECDSIIENYDLVISYHCKQIFPSKLVDGIRCVNIHPGYNPYNRGWYPQVFSIANGMKAGVTIHEMDEKIDHGPIIVRKEVIVLPEDTSGTVYPKIIQAEFELLKEWLVPILKSDYSTFLPETEGNVNYKKDFYEMCEIDLDEEVTAGDLIRTLRALTHREFNNAFFIDPITGNKIHISLNLIRQT